MFFVAQWMSHRVSNSKVQGSYLADANMIKFIICLIKAILINIFELKMKSWIRNDCYNDLSVNFFFIFFTCDIAYNFAT